MTYQDFRVTTLNTPPVSITSLRHNDLDELRAQIMRIVLLPGHHWRIGLYDITSRELAGKLALADQNYDAIRNHSENPDAPYALTGPQVEDHYLSTLQELVDRTLWVCHAVEGEESCHPFREIEEALTALLFAPGNREKGILSPLLPKSEDPLAWLTYAWLFEHLKGAEFQFMARMFHPIELHQRLVDRLVEVMREGNPEVSDLLEARQIKVFLGGTPPVSSIEGYTLRSLFFDAHNYETINELVISTLDYCRRAMDKHLNDRIPVSAYLRLRDILCPFVDLAPISNAHETPASGRSA